MKKDISYLRSCYRTGIFTVIACLLLVSCQANNDTIPLSSTRTPANTPALLVVTQPAQTSSPTPIETATLISTEVPIPASTFTATPTPTPTSTPSPWQLADLSNFFFYAGDYEVYLFHPDGINQFIDTGNVLFDGQPWSPDGTKFVFNTRHSSLESTQLAIANLQTGEVTHPLLRGEPYNVYWSPDGENLLYLDAGENYSILLFLYNLQTQQSQQIAEISRSQRGVFSLEGWSPDSQKVAFGTATTSEQYDLYVLDIETLKLEQLTNTPEVEVSAMWSPKENQLLFGTTSDPWAFSGWPYRAKNLYLIDESGENLKSLGEFTGLSSMAQSPDGTQIAYSNEARLCILTIATEMTVCPLDETLPISEYGSAFYSPPAWSADGRWLAFQVDKTTGNPCPYIYLLEVATNSVSDTGIGTCLGTEIYWSPRLP